MNNRAAPQDRIGLFVKRGRGIPMVCFIRKVAGCGRGIPLGSSCLSSEGAASDRCATVARGTLGLTYEFHGRRVAARFCESSDKSAGRNGQRAQPGHA